MEQREKQKKRKRRKTVVSLPNRAHILYTIRKRIAITIRQRCSQVSGEPSKQSKEGKNEKSGTIHSFGTYIFNFQKHAQETSFFHVLTSLANCFAEYEQRILYGALVVTVTAPCRFIIIIIIHNQPLPSGRCTKHEKQRMNKTIKMRRQHDETMRWMFLYR